MTTDPERAFFDLRDALIADLRPYIQEHMLTDLVTRIVAERVSGPGWKPPLGKQLDVIADARAARTRAALGADQ